jgi:hypothetical protein
MRRLAPPASSAPAHVAVAMRHDVPPPGAWQHETVTRSLTEWLELLRAELDTADDGRLQLSPAEERAILDLARVAAHASERIAAPLTTFIAGLALSGVPPTERAGRIRAITERLAAASASGADPATL